MAEMNLGKRCKYASQCPVYSGEENKDNTPLFIVKNIFCNRGYKGWKNCNKFQEYETNNKEADSSKAQE